MEMRNRDPRVAVVMITHNRCQEVLATLRHLTALAEQPALVLVDNQSTDGTPGAVARQYPQVRIVHAGGNLGAAGRNLGVQHVDTPYVAFCDDDTWWEPDALRQAADLFDTHPRLAVITGRVLVGHENEEDPICAELERSPLPEEPGMPGRPLLGFLAGASVVRRSAFLEAGGFTDRFFIGGEEELLATDLASAGWWLCYVPALVVHHHPSPHRDANDRRWCTVRNALWCAWLRRPLASALRKSWCLVSDAPGDRATWRGFAAALAGLPWVVSQRRVIPGTVEQGLRLLERA
jgi:GT2 family glycosyltransferase